MSIVRIGLGETKGNFADGYDAIFGKKDADKKPDASAEQSKKADKPEEKKEEKK